MVVVGNGGSSNCCCFCGGGNGIGGDLDDPSALLYTFWEPEMCTAGQRALLTITGPVSSFFYT